MDTNTIWRTSFEVLPATAKRPHIVCICCKAGSVTPCGHVAGLIPERLTDSVELAPYTAYYARTGRKFKAYRCLSCGYPFSEYEPLAEPSNKVL
jgi:hypothetical protein